MNRLTRQPRSFSSRMIGMSLPALAFTSQPWSEVKASGSSGTSVACVGRVLRTMSMTWWKGLPSILYSISG